MCLAKVIVEKDGKESVFAKNISNIKIEDGIVVLTDIMGSDFEVEGALLSADLVNGEVRISVDILETALCN
jgi:Predicted RNA-binding protein.